MEITKELDLKFEKIWILGNRFPENLKDMLVKEVEKIKENNVHLLGFIPNDDEISKINLVAENLLGCPTRSTAKSIYPESAKLAAETVWTSSNEMCVSSNPSTTHRLSPRVISV